MDLEVLVDGPYILGNTVRYLTESGEIEDEVLDRNSLIKVHVPNEDFDHFNLRLKPSILPSSEVFEMPSRLLAISDIEGNFDGLVSFLISNGVINADFDWSYGEGHLLINGDLVDRGAYPMALLWLVYKLESQAEAAGGQVHVILGNHDLMNIQGWCDYAHEDFKNTVKAVTGMVESDHAFRFMYSRNNEIGKWIRSKNAVTKIGNLLFVHGGLSYQILPFELSLAQINTIVRNNIDQDFYFNSTDNPMVNMVMGKTGPIWYRNLARAHDGRPKDSQEQFESVLKYYKVDRMIIGHTVVPEICTDYGGKLIKIDVLHGQSKYSGKTRGLLIENGNLYVADDWASKKNLT